MPTSPFKKPVEPQEDRNPHDRGGRPGPALEEPMDESVGNVRKSALRGGPYSASAAGSGKFARVEEDSLPRTLFGGGPVQSEGVPGTGGAGERGAGGSGGAGGDGGGGGVDPGTLDAGIVILLAKMEAMNTNLDSKFVSLQSQLSDQAAAFNSEIAKLRAELVSQVEFKRLEKRLDDLEAGCLPTVQIDFLQEQLNRLDPANKSLCFAGFKSTSSNGRDAQIKAFLKDIMAEDLNICQIQHIFKGPVGSRSMSQLSVVEFSSRDLRERVLKKVDERGGSMPEDDSNNVSIKRAKIQWQLKRNASLKKASEILKKDPRAKDKEVTIEWQMEGTKDRAVKIGADVVFLQNKTDATGKFQKPFDSLILGF